MNASSSFGRMGTDYGFIGKVTIPAAKLAAFREAVVDGTKMKGWLEDFGAPEAPGELGELTVERVLGECPDLEVKWREDGVDMKGVASDDSDTWLTHRVDIATIVRTAAKLGGEGELLIVSLHGDDDATWQVVASADGKSKMSLLRGMAAQIALKQVKALTPR